MEREFLDKLFQVLRNYAEYKMYGGKMQKAVATIRKKHPEIPELELILLFGNCVAAYNEAVDLVMQNIPHYSSADKKEFEPEIQFRKKYSVVPEEILNWTIGWVYHWHYER
jgi:hypothetical protein